VLKQVLWNVQAGDAQRGHRLFEIHCVPEHRQRLEFRIVLEAASELTTVSRAGSPELRAPGGLPKSLFNQVVHPSPPDRMLLTFRSGVGQPTRNPNPLSRRGRVHAGLITFASPPGDNGKHE
jgi:hypothetical protein